MTKKNSLARSVGQILAFGSHTVDRVIGWGFKSMRKASESKAPATPPKSVLGKAAQAGKGLLSFLGTAGEAYYERYDELKKKGK